MNELAANLPQIGTLTLTPDTDVTEGVVEGSQQLVIVAESDLVVFGDGIESDAIPLTWGQRAAFTVAERQLRLVA